MVCYGVRVNKAPSTHVRIVRHLGADCKTYVEQVRGRDRWSIEKQPCPYNGCRSLKVWFWGWYCRVAGAVPCGPEGEPSPELPIRRFFCPACGRTFSWRPRFLVFGHRYAAVVYEQVLRDWSLGRATPECRHPECWFRLSPAAARALRRRLVRAALPALRLDPEKRPLLWHVLRRLTSKLRQTSRPRLLAFQVLALLQVHPAHRGPYWPGAN